MIEFDDELEEGAGTEEELYVHHRFVADAGQKPLRVDKFLFNFLEKMSSNPLTLPIFWIMNILTLQMKVKKLGLSAYYNDVDSATHT